MNFNFTQFILLASLQIGVDLDGLEVAQVLLEEQVVRDVRRGIVAILEG